MLEINTNLHSFKDSSYKFDKAKNPVITPSSTTSTFSGRSVSTPGSNDSLLNSSLTPNNKLMETICEIKDEILLPKNKIPTELKTSHSTHSKTPPLKKHNPVKDFPFFEICLRSLSNDLKELNLSSKKINYLNELVSHEMGKLKNNTTPKKIPEWNDDDLLGSTPWNPMNLHANHDCLATGYPDDPEAFWEDVVTFNVGATFDLTNLEGDLRREDFQEFYYPQKIRERKFYENITVTCVNQTKLPHFTLSQYQIHNLKKQTDHYSYRIHVSDWKDGATISTEKLGILVRAMQTMRLLLPEASHPNSSPILVHCMGGVGRTGTLISAEAMHTSINKLLPKQSIAKHITPKVTATILKGRFQRSRYYVQTPQQEATVYNYALIQAHSLENRLSEIV